MFEAALKGTGTRGGNGEGWRTFGSKDAERWKREGSPQSMLRLRKRKRQRLGW